MEGNELKTTPGGFAKPKKNQTKQNKQTFSQNKNQFHFCPNSGPSPGSSQVIFAFPRAQRAKGTNSSSPALSPLQLSQGKPSPSPARGSNLFPRELSVPGLGLFPRCQAGVSSPRNKQQPPFGLSSVKSSARPSAKEPQNPFKLFSPALRP